MIGDHSQLNSWAVAHLALVVEWQSRLSELTGPEPTQWEINLSTGLLTLNGCRLQCALLGGVDETENTWLWSWADPDLDQQAIAIQRGLPLVKFGEESGLWQFTRPRFSMDGVMDLGMTTGATVAIVACPQIMGGAIFSGMYQNKRAYTVLTDPRLTMELPTAYTVPRYISGAISYGVGNHRDIVTVFAEFHQLAVEDYHGGLMLSFEDQTQLEVAFDGLGRICGLHTHGL